MSGIPEWHSLAHLTGGPPILQAIILERRRQDKEHGPSTLRKDVSLAIWNAALVEEVGEVARALLNLRGPKPEFDYQYEDRVSDLRDELIHVAAVAWAMVEALDSGTGVEL